jgi:hypothetical protein
MPGVCGFCAILPAMLDDCLIELPKAFVVDGGFGIEFSMTTASLGAAEAVIVAFRLANISSCFFLISIFLSCVLILFTRERRPSALMTVR